MFRYKQYCPIARASEVIADRWTPLILRELLAGSHRFNEIERGLPGISRSLLSSRLRHLEKNGVVERRVKGNPRSVDYLLTEAGKELQKPLMHLGAWAVHCAFGEPQRDELNAGLLVWNLHRRIHRERLPERRTVVEFDFTGPKGRRVWLVLEPREVSVCLKPPGFDSNLIVRSDLGFFYRIWFGYAEFDEAVRCGAISLEGPASLARAFPRWFLWSPIASVVRRGSTLN